MNEENKQEVKEVAGYSTCDSCGASNETVEWLEDPFLDEVHGELDFSHWCSDCWSDRKRDI